jgi:L-aspartate oxidase
VSETDVLVLGGGLAGLMTALHVAEFATVTVVTKAPSEQTNTSQAQGGIAAVFDARDSFAAHARDTLTCGAGLCDRDVVGQVVREAPDAVRELEALGVHFSKRRGAFELGREGGHSARRIVHVRDYTGRAIETALLERVRAHPRIRVEERALALDLLMASRLPGARLDGVRRPRAGRDECWGAYVMNRDTRRIRPITARATVLATGGCGKVYLYTSNPDAATGDGIAMAYRAGAPVTHLEFVQFHPTCLYHPEAKSFLLSEALRGEGARLYTLDGTRFMPAGHPLAELAPRDVVARAIDRELKRRGDPHVYSTSASAGGVGERRFPHIAESSSAGGSISRTSRSRWCPRRTTCAAASARRSQGRRRLRVSTRWVRPRARACTARTGSRAIPCSRRSWARGTRRRRSAPARARAAAAARRAVVGPRHASAARERGVRSQLGRGAPRDVGPS